MGVHDELVYLAGGMTTLDGPYQDAVTTVTAFNTTSEKWQRLIEAAANVPEGRQHAGRVAGTLFTLLEAGARRMPTPRGGLAGTIAGAKLYTFGGETNQQTVTGVFDDVEAFDFKTREWTILKLMTVPRHGSSAVVVGNKIYIPGGGLQQDGLTVVVDGIPHFLNTTNHFDVFTV
ncbi:hypothetical protein QQZ08_012408 [Neonectria magnoliae]|uniref:Galactose oxidase n=1 Tax=Neonectria magnoliae TaxID=2732573 RepID=A0ABR1H2W9_9HYPO